MTTYTVARTKAHLIDTLVQRGLSRRSLNQLSLNALGALIDQTQTAQPRLARVAAAAEAARAAEPPSLQLRRQPPRRRRTHAGKLSAVFDLNPAWSSADRATIQQLAAEHGADSCRPDADGRYVAVLNERRVLFWVSRHQIDLPGGTSIRLSTARPFRPSA